MKTKLLLLLCVGFMPFWALAEPTVVMVWNTDGTENTSFALSDAPIVAFPSGKMTITVKGTETSFEFAKVSKLTYTSPSALKGVKDESGKPFQMSDNSLLFSAGNKGSKIMIVGSNGIMVLQKPVKAGETLSIPLGKFAAGIYVVKVNDITYKIVKK